MRLIYNDKYQVIDDNMSDSNVGARKGKNIRNHIFVINGIITDILNTKGKAVDIQILDYKQCFDAMWLEETLNDLYEAGVNDDQLAILYEANKTVDVAVKTPHGLTAREAIKKIIMQGDVFGPIQCSVTVDTYGKEALAEDKHQYIYKGCVKVPPLAMIDDLITVTECRYKSTMANSYLNSKTAVKKLQFGIEKCHKMHVASKKVDEICPDLFVEGWKIKEVEEINVDHVELEEEHVGECKMEEVTEEKYLGDIISVDGKNMKNIVSRVNRGTGIVTQIMGILEEICFGKYFFEVARMLRNSLLLSSLLTNCEAWYHLTNEEIIKLEQVDEDLIRRILECPRTTPKEMLYLEMNCIPIRFIIKSRRLNFLRTILNEEQDSLIFRFLQAQLDEPTKNDWGTSVHEDLKSLEMSPDLNEVKQASSYTFKNDVKKRIVKDALKYLNYEKASHSKVLHIVHTEMELQDYLSPTSGLVSLEAKFIFMLRTRMLDIKSNYQGKHTELSCPLCETETDTQQHILQCDKLKIENELIKKIPEYDELFGRNLDSKIMISRIIKSRFQERNKILKERSKSLKEIK